MGSDAHATHTHTRTCTHTRADRCASCLTLVLPFVFAAELGDYSHSEHLPGYLSEFCFIQNAPQDFEKEIAKHHQQHT